MGALYLGIDLGTTNSTAAVFDGDKITLVRNSQGSTLTPSVVRFDARGNVTVGAKARRLIDSDPANTRSEFKRVMGTDKRFEIPAIGKSLLPEELASHVLTALRADVKEQLGVESAAAVITVPALFEVPQSAATSRAAQLAGFGRVELLQEPVASALAAGWTSDTKGAWLVYDLGGGTFDVSLLETRDGLLRVVGHDGDNFLGGRDFDSALIEWVLEELGRKGTPVRRADPTQAQGFSKLKLAIEDARIELTRAERANVLVPACFMAAGVPVDVDVDVDRTTMERVCMHLVDRSLAVCKRLLDSHGRSVTDLSQLVLVGGPTVMPFLRTRLSEAIGAPFASQLDAMTLVAQGAALYAATAGLDAVPATAPKESGERVWLSYPAMTPDLTPHVVGKMVEGKQRVARVRARRIDGWTSPDVPLDGEAAFVIAVDVLPRRPNTFKLEGFAEDGSPAPIMPSAFSIMQGMTISDPPLSRTIGVALADDTVHVYFERGAPLPARRSFRHRVVESVVPGTRGFALNIPIIQGDLDRAHLCRLVGTLQIDAARIKQTIPAGSPIEVTLELDRGGTLSAKALIPATGDVFEDVAHLLGPDASPDTLDATLAAVKKRVDDDRRKAFAAGSLLITTRLSELQERLDQAGHAAEAARGGDADAAQRAHRLLSDIDAELDMLTREQQWPELTQELTHLLAVAAPWIETYATDGERKLFAEVHAAAERARSAKQAVELRRQIRLLHNLFHASRQRDPEYWPDCLEACAADIASADDQARAERLVREGRGYVQRGQRTELARTVRELWSLMPHTAASRQAGHDSGIR
jgi:molecular chaperone DnaK